MVIPMVLVLFAREVILVPEDDIAIQFVLTGNRLSDKGLIELIVLSVANLIRCSPATGHKPAFNDIFS